MEERQRIKEHRPIPTYKIGDRVYLDPTSTWFTGTPIAQVILVGYKWLTVNYNGRKIRLHPHDLDNHR